MLLVRKNLNVKREKDPLSALAGTSLKVYLYLLENTGSKPIGVRELQRAMGFKSPSTAKHHLERLEEMGLAVRLPGGEYKAVSPKTGLLSVIFFTLFRRLIPISLPFSALGLTLVVSDILINGLRDPLLLLSTVLLSLVLLYQAIVIIKWVNILKRGK